MSICSGSGVPEDVFEWGHEVIPGTEEYIFLMRTDGKSDNTYSQTRCRRCASTRYHFKENSDFRNKGLATIRKHAVRTVEKGFAPDVERARAQLFLAGVTPEFAASVMLDAVGKACPGFCCDVIKDDRLLLGRRVEPYIIRDRHDVEFDWRDPRYQLTPENSGPLCPVCNRQKGDIPWPVFMLQQRGIRTNLEQARAFDPPLRLFVPV